MHEGSPNGSNAAVHLLPVEEVDRAKGELGKLISRLNSVILGQKELTELVVIGILARGHVLLEGLPGLGKTELVKGLAGLLGLTTRRIQFTPDLMPGDILGTPILEEHGGARRMVFHPGPIFSQLLLADEINRGTPKTQSALLEAMQERRVTVMGESRGLPTPFFVLATQNPIELEGTYPLPEAQVDRFAMKITVEGLSSEVLEQIVKERPHGRAPQMTPIMDSQELLRLMDAVDAVVIPTGVANYIARLVSATYPGNGDGDSELKKFIRFGASPRAAIALASTARAAALMEGRPNIGFSDVRKTAPSVLGHRIILDYGARLEGWTPQKIVARLIETIPDVSTGIPADIRGGSR